MNFQINESKIDQDRYIELKQKAYDYYRQYNSLDRVLRKSYIDALPEMDTPFETMLVRNTLLFPDTEELLTTPKEALYRVLNKFARDNDFITKEDMMTKYLEYRMQDTQDLVKTGLLQVMEDISYPDNSISNREYLFLKEEAMEISDEFQNLPLSKKVKFIVQCCEDSDYQTQIQLSTLLIPNDQLLINQSNKYSDDELASYYSVPTSLINFKKEEYNKQDTLELINEDKLLQPKSNHFWYKDGVDDGMISKIWTQKFYREIEQEYIARANVALDKMFGDSKKINK